ncbi:MAG: 23S rRNA (uracil(1939)-C(5))-methyltransferase RlmD [Bacteroidota bacterium]
MGRRFIPFQASMILEDAASDGLAVARHGERVIFVERGVPGDTAMVNVFRRKKKALIGKILSVEEPSSDRISPLCEHFGVCGGCKWQMMQYAAQLKWKQKQVHDAFQRIAKVEVKDKKPILGADPIYHYRNKLEFTFSSKAWLTREQISSDQKIDQRVLGYHTPRIFDKIIDIDTCHLQREIINDIRNRTKEIARELGIPFYDIREHTGFLRSLVFRSAEYDQELMLTLIVSAYKPAWLEAIFSRLASEFPQINHFIYIVNEKLNSSYSDLAFHVWRGKNYVTEKLGKYLFKISPTSFFQTNPFQAERLYATVKQFLKDSLPEGKNQHELIYDLYTGTGSIGIYVSELAKSIVGIEYVESAVKDAYENASLNQLTHLRFHAGDMKKVLDASFVAEHGTPDVIITDPPRAGMDPKVVERVLALSPEHIIYVSCKPSTQARDVALLDEQYEVLAIQPVDMFPQTAHVENVAWLKKRSLAE